MTKRLWSTPAFPKKWVLASILLIGGLSAGCAANLCERKNQFFERHCTGTDLTYTPDYLCEPNLENCTAGQLQAFEAYIQCLEDAKVCSMEVVGQCAAQHPGGVNLQCPKRS